MRIRKYDFDYGRRMLLQKAAVGALLAADLPAVVVNARQVRDFAKGTGQLAKTDAIDAGILAHFGEVVATVVRPLPAPEILEFRDLCDRRGQLVRMLATEKNHRHAAQGASPKVIKNIDKVSAFLQRQIEELEDRLDRLVAASATATGGSSTQVTVTVTVVDELPGVSV